jgi:F0F1-type ATP synthase delta subunit
MRVTDYTSAMLELIQNGMSEDVAFDGLALVLQKRGHKRLYPKILRAMHTLTEKQFMRKAITITVAQIRDSEKFKEHITKAVTALEGTTYETRIDSTITGGFIAESSERRIDASYKKRLLTLYRSLIA